MGRTDPTKLTANERKFLLLYPQHNFDGGATWRAMNPKKKGKKFYDTSKSAACMTLKNIRRKLGSAFWEEMGLSDDQIARVYREAMDATIVKPFCNDGVIIEAGPYVDHSTRKSAADSVAKLKGLFVDKHEVSGPGGGPIEHALAELPEEALRALASRSRCGTGEKASD